MKNLINNKIIIEAKIANIIFVLLLIGQGTLYAQDTRLPLPVNTDKLTLTAPHISYDGKYILFVTQGPEGERLYEGRLADKDSVESVRVIDALVFPDSVKATIGSATYNQSATRIYLSLAFDGSDHDIYVLKRSGEDFLPPEKLSETINSEQNEFDPCISPDEKVLYFVRNQYEGYSSMFVCGKLYESIKNENDWTRPVLLPAPVNENCERSPRVAADGKTLYFSSIRDDLTEGSDIMYTKKIGRGVWLNPAPVFSENKGNDELFPSVTASGNKMIYLSAQSSLFKTEQHILLHTPSTDYRPERTVVPKGRVADKQSKLSIPAVVEVQNPHNSLVLSRFSNDSETGFYRIYLPSGKRFKIAVKAKNYSTGFFYIQSSDFNENGELEKDIELFSEAELLLNVFDADIAEPLEATIKITDTETGKALNLPINTVGKGRYIITLPLGKAYNISTTKEYYSEQSLDLDLTGIVQFDRFEKDTELSIQTGIYELELKDAKTGAGIKATVEIKNLTTGEVMLQEVETDESGKVKLQLREGEEYEINVTPKGYAFYSVNVSLSDKRSDNKTVASIEPLQKETKIKLNRIFFEFNSADLNATSFEELDRVVKLLENNPDIKIEISAHTDDVGSDAYNMKLSDRRAHSVVDYITQQGIRQEALIAKGYGETQPAFKPADNDENRKKNRRVEMRIVETE